MLCCSDPGKGGPKEAEIMHILKIYMINLLIRDKRWLGDGP